MPEIIAHRDFVETQLANSLGTPSGVMFATETPEQTKVVMDAIIGNSEKDLWLMARTLNKKMADPEEIRKALQKQNDLFIKVIVEMADPFSCQHSALSDLKMDASARSRVEVRKLPAPSPVHLSIGDFALARIQEDDKRPATLVAFHNPEISKRATDRFSVLWDRSARLSWPPLEAAKPTPA
ncbi:MAG: hypothetical protein QOJ86_4991 [Bradyrhizobium sp.]|jgi:hypothetical protein|nr:hypothetical protein [Bradyrhizobium sp.]